MYTALRALSVRPAPGCAVKQSIHLCRVCYVVVVASLCCQGALGTHAPNHIAGEIGHRIVSSQCDDSGPCALQSRTLMQTPAPDEGEDGVLEGNGEGTVTPAPDEGDDGVLEGNGEGFGTPAADEGADGVLEGNGEGTGGTPAADEGEDGILEGKGEGTGTPAPSEGEDGVFEGSGEGVHLSVEAGLQWRSISLFQ